MDDLEKIVQELKNTIKNIKHASDEIAVFVVANVKDVTENLQDYPSHSIVTEYFTESELEEIVLVLRANNIYTDVSTDEIEFIEKVVSGKVIKLPHKFKIIYTTAQKGTGPGRKSLIPAFCNMNNLAIIGSNAYVRVLCRHKYHCYAVLKYHGIQNLDAWLYDHKGGWLLSRIPPLGMQVIAKPVYESASIGIYNNSVFNFEPHLELSLENLSKQFGQPIIIQEFVPGYEVEIPVLNDSHNSYSIGAIGISIDGRKLLKSTILTYDLVFNDDYSFYDFKEFDYSVILEMRRVAEYCVKILGIEGLGRVDFRVSEEGKYYITDIATNPHITKHSSFNFAYNQLGLTYPDLPLSMIALAAKKNHWF